MELVYKTLLHAIMITGFVFVMMLVIEYINVQSKGLWQKFLTKNKWSQYLIAGLLGAIPGCLGAFTIVAMYSHRLVSFGALVTTMIATSGDESFVMFALIPEKAILLTLIIFVVGVLAGYITDKLYKPTKALEQISTHKLPLHNEPDCKCFEKDKIWFNLFHPSFHRITTSIIILILITGVSTGIIAGGLEIWMKISVLLAFLFSLFIVITVPNHFLKKHIWAHIVKKHLPRIFLWVFGTLLLMHFLMNYIDVQAWITSNMFVVLIIAILVGLIPESGPHLIFVTLFAQGSIPFSILLASSISQDGHGMLPMLAESRRTFLAVKIVNIIYAFIVGASTFLLGF
ncbi:putative manganese transporter [Lutibacter sp. A80]|uniref:putative manganese transporter n=1 Tax=Lutibacter sp. A80 TaxID=2918453 RepID=UPI001F06BA0B|nr:putative manganese transporter [Lutibacter sp. A80]UMB61676.1 putative manganese transporter [Lutibacter sp. A80]